MTRGRGLRWSLGFWAAVVAVVSAFGTRSAQAATCREGPNASPNTCSLPAGLGNFQGQPPRHSTRISVIVCTALQNISIVFILHI